jgi:hypothetical protein
MSAAFILAALVTVAGAYLVARMTTTHARRRARNSAPARTREVRHVFAHDFPDTLDIMR